MKMNNIIIFLIVSCMILMSTLVYAKSNKKNVIYVKDQQINPVSTKECQHWGGFNNERCVYKKTIYAIELINWSIKFDYFYFQDSDIIPG
ncbi:hypothetical protein GMJAKD_03760 [Candidatus Electrothrix aarhusensis]